MCAAKASRHQSRDSKEASDAPVSGVKGEISKLKQLSVELLKSSQDSRGGFVSHVYGKGRRHVRLGHGVFACFALDLVGEHDLSSKFYDWALENVRRYGKRLKDAVASATRGGGPKASEFMPVILDPDGSELTVPSANSVGDYGTLLWGLTEHVHRSGDESHMRDFRIEIDNAVSYVCNMWQVPSGDFWGERSDRVHISTLAQVAGGLNWVNAYLIRKELDVASNEILSFLWSKLVEGDHFAGCYDLSKDKTQGLDATALLLSVPFQIVSHEDPILSRTVSLVESMLARPASSEAGTDEQAGAVWLPEVLLLALHYGSVGRAGDAEKVLSWVCNNSAEQGELPERVFPLCSTRARARASGANEVRQAAFTLSHALYVMATSLGVAPD